MKIFLLITDRCNLSCSMCICGKNSEVDMNYDDLKKYMDKEDLSDAEIVITGGEPTLHERFCDFVKYFSKRAKSVLICTNGIMNDYAKELENEENVYFKVSLDGDKKAHDLIRGKGSYDKTLKTLKKYEKHNIRYSIGSVVNKRNKDIILDLIPRLDELENMWYWRVAYEMPFQKSNYEDMMSAAEWNEFVDEVLRRAHFKVDIQYIFPFKHYDRVYGDKIDEAPKRKCYHCGTGDKKLYIAPNFDAYPCNCLKDICVGSLVECTLDQIFFGRRMKALSSRKMDEDVACNECKYYNKFCSGGCMGMSYHKFGTLTRGDMRCPILKEQEEKELNK